MPSKQPEFPRSKLEKNLENLNQPSARERMPHKEKAKQYEAGLRIQRQRELEKARQESSQLNTPDKKEITQQHIEQYINEHERDIIKAAENSNIPVSQYRQMVKERITDQIEYFWLDNDKLRVKGQGGMLEEAENSPTNKDDLDHISIEIPSEAYTHDNLNNKKEVHNTEVSQDIKSSEWIQKVRELFYSNQSKLGAQNKDQVLLTTMEELSKWAEGKTTDGESIRKELDLARKLIKDMHQTEDTGTIHKSIDEITYQLKKTKNINKWTKGFAIIGTVGTIATIVAATYTVELAKHAEGIK